MKIKTAILWSLLNGRNHPLVADADLTIHALRPLVDGLFPGINYFSVTGFGQVMRDCAIPVLRKRFPELLTTPSEAVQADALTEIAEPFLPSKGYEWQNSLAWKGRFDARLAAQSRPSRTTGSKRARA